MNSIPPVTSPPATPSSTPPSQSAELTPLFAGAQPNIHQLLGLEVLEAGPERVVLRLPVDWKVHQPYGILHGGVSALLAESAASLGGALAAAPDRSVVGIELNASHLRSLREGHLTATATPARIGRTVQVWHISLTDDEGRAICEARCSLAVIATPPVTPNDAGASPPASAGGHEPSGHEPRGHEQGMKEADSE